MTSPLTDAAAREIAERVNDQYSARKSGFSSVGRWGGLTDEQRARNVALVHAGAVAVPRGEVTDAVIAEAWDAAVVGRTYWFDWANQGEAWRAQFRDFARQVAARVGGGDGALALDVLKCIPADWKPGYGREWGNLGRIIAEYVGDLERRAEQAESALAEAKRVKLAYVTVADDAERRLAEAKREGAREALTRWGDTLDSTAEAFRYNGALAALAIRDFRDREYPAPTPASVELSDGRVVMWDASRPGFVKKGRSNESDFVCDPDQWRLFAITGSDFDKLKAFAARVAL